MLNRLREQEVYLAYLEVKGTKGSRFQDGSQRKEGQLVHDKENMTTNRRKRDIRNRN